MGDMLKGTPNEHGWISDETQEFVLDITPIPDQEPDTALVYVYKFPGEFQDSADDPELARQAERDKAAQLGQGMLEFVTAKQYFDRLLPAADGVQPDEELTDNMLKAVAGELEHDGAHPIEARWIAAQALSVIVESRQIAAERAGRQ